MAEPKYGIVGTVPAEDNPCGHATLREWEFCPTCARVSHENSLRRMREAGERAGAERERLWWEAFQRAFNPPYSV